MDDYLVKPNIWIEGEVQYILDKNRFVFGVNACYDDKGWLSTSYVTNNDTKQALVEALENLLEIIKKSE